MQHSSIKEKFGYNYLNYPINVKSNNNHSNFISKSKFREVNSDIRNWNGWNNDNNYFTNGRKNDNFGYKSNYYNNSNYNSGSQYNNHNSYGYNKLRNDNVHSTNIYDRNKHELKNNYNKN